MKLAVSSRSGSLVLVWDATHMATAVTAMKTQGFMRGILSIRVRSRYQKPVRQAQEGGWTYPELPECAVARARMWHRANLNRIRFADQKTACPYPLI